MFAAGRHQTRSIVIAATTIIAAGLPMAGSTALAAEPARFVTIVAQYPDQTFQASWVAPDQTITGTGSTSHLTVRGSGGTTTDAYLEFYAPVGAELVAGTYQVSGLNFPTPTEAAIHASAGGTGCTGPGWFEILEAPLLDASSEVTVFAARWELNCGNRQEAGVTGIDPTVAVKAIAFEPEELQFGTGAVGVASDPQTIHVKNVGTGGVAITAATLGGADPDSYLVQNGCASLDPGSTCGIGVRLRPALDGNRHAWVSIASDALPLAPQVRLGGQGILGTVTNTEPNTAAIIGALPYVHGGLVPNDLASACGATGRSVWYRYTATAKKRILFHSQYPSGPPQLYQGSLSSMAKVQCGSGQDIEFTALPGVTYWVNLVTTYPAEDRAIVKVTEGQPDDGVLIYSLSRTPSTFYPYVDGYLDTVTIKGNSGEPVSVSVRIYSPANKPVRALSAPMATGAFALKWNGRSTAGVAQPAGKYRLVVSLTDTWGNRLVSTMHVYLSRKRLYTYSYTKTIDAGAYKAHAANGTGRVSRSASAYSGGVKIWSGTAGAAAVAYTFSVPAATVYKSVRFEALGVSRIPGIDVGLQLWSSCASFNVGCVNPWSNGPINYGWAGVRGGSNNVSGARAVRGYLHTSPYGGSNRYMDARDVRIRVTYGILK